MTALAKVSLRPFNARPVLIPQEHVREVWPLAAPFLKKAEKRDSLQSVAEWLGDAINGRAQLWLIWSDAEECIGAGITSLVESPSGKLCVINAFGAKYVHDDFLPVVEAWARAEQCNGIRIYGRLGWMRRLKGYKPIGILLNKGL